MQLENVADIYPLTSVQQGLLYHTITQPRSSAYVDQVSAIFSGDLDVAVFQRAWSEVINRHDTLRAAFLWEGLDEPLHVIRERVEPSWCQLDNSLDVLPPIPRG